MMPRQSDYQSVCTYLAALDEWKRGQAREERRMLGSAAIKALQAEVRELDAKRIQGLTQG